jgi:hypothetical protein
VVIDAAPKTKITKAIPLVAKECSEKKVYKQKLKTPVPTIPTARQQTVKTNPIRGMACGSNPATVATSGIVAFVKTELAVWRSK